MEPYLQEFHPPARLLLGPGPSNVSPRVLQAMTAPVLGYLDPHFARVMDDIRAMLRLVFQTGNRLTLPVSGTGSAGMEAALGNVLEPGDTLVVGVNGFFGERLTQIGERCGARVVQVQAPWGRPLDPEAVAAELRKNKRVKAVAVVHAETSTGVLNPVQEVARVAREHDALTIVDAVTSLGGIEVAVDQWGVDVSFSCSQKCLGCPPGLAPITLGPRAEEVLGQRKTPPHSWYLDLNLTQRYWSQNLSYHHTPPTSMLYGLREGLRAILEEGLQARFRRHWRNGAALHAGLEALGLGLFAQQGYRLPVLTSVRIPDGLNDDKVRSALLNEYNIEIGRGQGAMAGKIWRIGLMGENSRPSAVFSLLSALEQVLPREGFEVAKGESVAAAQRVLAEGDGSVAK
ncbi:MAG: alanine--glyoxylate aminotransferase family protein [Chloroflexi bacterium]|nr:alanine--glyoxylate aminotransferase family protein [Chloroflexota bacterium]